MWLRRAQDAARLVGALAFLVVFATFVAAVFMRYAAGTPIQWADEFVTIATMWVVFWMSALVMTDREQVSIDLVYTALPPQGRRAAGLAAALLFGSLFAVALPPVLDYVGFLWRTRTNILEWRLDIVFLCLPLFFAAVVIRSAVRIAPLAFGDWRRHVADDSLGAAAAETLT
jgi:TRAP-type C4-dicarboxylate transport system permease small subunit